MNTQDYLLIKTMFDDMRSSLIIIPQKLELGELSYCQTLMEDLKEKLSFIESHKQEFDLTDQELNDISHQLEFYYLQLSSFDSLLILSEKMYHMEDEILLLRYGLDKVSVRLLIVCGEGISSGFIVNRIQKYADKDDIIKALPITMLRENIEQFDVILVAPHLRHKTMIVEKMCDLHHKAYGVIEASTYGKMDGVVILKQAKELFMNKRTQLLKKLNAFQ